ncbi:MAG: glycosyltransferase [Bacilli bacterium]|nr:glycosyltransferase [Bacilli bacterium]
MKITIVCDVLGKENNGTTIAAMNLIRSLKAKGHEVRVVCPDQDKKDLPGYYIVETFNLGPLNNYVKKNGVVLAKANKKIIYEAIKDVDCVHLMTPFSLSKAAAKMAKQLKKPLTAGFHCQAENFTNHIFMMNNRLVNYLTYKYFYKKVFRYCDYIHYPSQFIKDEFESIVGKTNGVVISNGVNREFKKQITPRQVKDQYLILFTGRYSKEKSHRILIDAVAKSKYKDKIQLVFAGAGPLKEKLEKRAKKLPLKPIFNFFKRQELIEIINSADLYVHPAEIEIEAIACLEAITCGLVPIISNSKRSATRHFALSEKNLFNCNDSEDLAKKIDYWLDHPEEKQELSQAYLNYKEKFDHDLCMDEMEKMLHKAAN